MSKYGDFSPKYSEQQYNDGLADLERALQTNFARERDQLNAQLQMLQAEAAQVEARAMMDRQQKDDVLRNNSVEIEHRDRIIASLKEVSIAIYIFLFYRYHQYHLFSKCLYLHPYLFILVYISIGLTYSGAKQQSIFIPLKITWERCC